MDFVVTHTFLICLFPLLAISSLLSHNLSEIVHPLTFSSSHHLKKTLIVYSGPVIPNDKKYDTNFRIFLRLGIFKSPKIDFIVVLSEETYKEYKNILPQYDNVKYLFRKNRCYDMESYRITLNTLSPKVKETYSFFIFLNCGLRGPFLPTYLPPTIHWPDLFTHFITPTIKLVGITFNCEHTPHVQSMLWATDTIGLSILQPKCIFDCMIDSSLSPEQKQEIIHKYEICLTVKILENNYGFTVINSFQNKQLQGDKWKNLSELCPDNGPSSLWFKSGKYPGNPDLHPLDTIFYKMINTINPKEINAFTALALGIKTEPTKNENRFASRRPKLVR
jgi:hypothetical protein